MSEEKALKKAMEAKWKEFVEKGAEVYAKACYHYMKIHTWVLPAGLMAVAVPWLFAQAQTSATSTPDARVKRGQYLVERVALCADCHTERDWKGRQSPERWLRGARLDFKPTKLMPWAEVAPDIAGLPMFASDEQAVSYFKTGQKPDKRSSKPPMPQYRLDDSDAAAVVAYLRSLKPTEPKAGK